MQLIILFIFLYSVECRASCPPLPGESPPPGCSLTFIQDQDGQVDCQEDEDCPYSLDWWNSDGRKDQVCGTVGFEYYKCENERCKPHPLISRVCTTTTSSSTTSTTRRPATSTTRRPATPSFEAKFPPKTVSNVGGIAVVDHSQCRFCPKASDPLQCPSERPCRSTTGYCEEALCNRKRCWCDIYGLESIDYYIDYYYNDYDVTTTTTTTTTSTTTTTTTTTTTATTSYEHFQRCKGRNFFPKPCCTPQNPCSEGEGDCEVDNDCSGDLVCGNNNCKQFGSVYHEKDDCCVKPDPVQWIWI